jgi:hypothetical protein
VTAAFGRRRWSGSSTCPRPPYWSMPSPTRRRSRRRDRRVTRGACRGGEGDDHPERRSISTRWSRACRARGSY